MKPMPTQPLPADSFYEYVPGTDNWVIKKKSGNKILSKKDIKAYEGGWPGEEDSVTWGAAAPNTYSDEPAINHDYPLGENEPEKEGPTRAEFIKHFVENAHPEHGHIVDVSIKDRSVTFQDGQKFSFDDLTNLLPSPDRGSDNPTVNDYSQNYFWGPTDLGKAHQNQPGANGWLPAGTEDMDGPSPNSRMSSLKEASVENYWVDPNGKFYPVSVVHTSWIWNNREKLLNNYNFKIQGVSSNDEYLANDMYSLIRAGWTRIRDNAYGEKIAIEVKDIHNIPSYIWDFIFKHDQNLQIALGDLNKNFLRIKIEDLVGGQNSVNKALRQSKMASFSSFMRKQSSLNKKEITKKANPPARFWIAPDGKEFEVPAAGHGAWLRQNPAILKQYGIDTKDVRGNLYSIYEQMYNKGWVRISNEPWGNGFQIELNDINRIPSFLDGFVAQNFSDGDVIKIGNTNRAQFAEITDPFPSLQKAVNKQLMGTRASLKKASLDDVLDQTTQDAIAAEYGVQYLIPLRLYSEATSYGQEQERAFRYAIEESKRMHQEIDPNKLAELIETYF